MSLDEPVWDVTVFTKNKNRQLKGDVAHEFLCEVIAQANGRLIGAWASSKSFQSKDQKNAPHPGRSRAIRRWTSNGESRSNDTNPLDMRMRG
jgi:hypothetical protein